MECGYEGLQIPEVWKLSYLWIWAHTLHWFVSGCHLFLSGKHSPWILFASFNEGKEIFATILWNIKVTFVWVDKEHRLITDANKSTQEMLLNVLCVFSASVSVCVLCLGKGGKCYCCNSKQPFTVYNFKWAAEELYCGAVPSSGPTEQGRHWRQVLVFSVNCQMLPLLMLFIIGIVINFWRNTKRAKKWHKQSAT